MAAFLLAASALTALVLGLVLPPLWRPVPAEGAAPTAVAPARRSAWLIALLLPAAAMGLHGLLSGPAGPAAPAPAAVPPAAEAPPVTAAQVQAMVQRLAARLQQQPDDEAGWRLLARSYEQLGRHAEAAQAHGELARLHPRDPQPLLDQAVSLAMADAEQGLAGAPLALLQKALALAPEHPQTLALLGSAAYDRADYRSAVRLWQQALQGLPAADPAAQALQDRLREARRQLPPARPSP